LAEKELGILDPGRFRPGNQAMPQQPSGGFFIYGLAGLEAISLGYRHLEVSHKRINLVWIPTSVDVLLNDTSKKFVYQAKLNQVSISQAKT
jgi:hypothetical protein